MSMSTLFGRALKADYTAFCKKIERKEVGHSRLTHIHNVRMGKNYCITGLHSNYGWLNEVNWDTVAYTGHYHLEPNSFDVVGPSVVLPEWEGKTAVLPVHELVENLMQFYYGYKESFTGDADVYLFTSEHGYSKWTVCSNHTYGISADSLRSTALFMARVGRSYPLWFYDLHDHARLATTTRRCSCGAAVKKSVRGYLYDRMEFVIQLLARDKQVKGDEERLSLEEIRNGKYKWVEDLPRAQNAELPQAQLLDLKLSPDVSPEVVATVQTLSGQLTALASDSAEGLNIQRRLTSLVLKLFTAWRSAWDLPTCGLLIADFLSEYFADKTKGVFDVFKALGVKFGSFMSQIGTPAAQSDAPPDPSVPLSIGALVFACMAAIVGYKTSMPSIYTALKAVSITGMALKSVAIGVPLLGALIEKAYHWVYYKMYGVPVDIATANNIVEGIEDYYLRVATTLRLAQDHDFFEHVHNRVRVMTLMTEGLGHSSALADAEAPAQTISAFRLHFQQIERLYTRLLGSRYSMTVRPEPLVLYLHGGTGIGKSVLALRLARDLIMHLQPDIGDHIVDNIYMRSIWQDFWDGYNHQLVVVYDDIGTLRDTTSNPNLEFVEILKTANIAAYPLHMAELSRKAATAFTSPVVICTANMPHYAMPSMTNPQAFERRLDIKTKVTIETQFAKTIPLAGHNNTTILDRDKVFNLTGQRISTAPYCFDVEDGSNGLTYDQFLDHAKKALDAKMEHSNNLRRWIMNRAEVDVEPATDSESGQEPDDVFSDTASDTDTYIPSESDYVEDDAALPPGLVVLMERAEDTMFEAEARRGVHRARGRYQSNPGRITMDRWIEFVTSHPEAASSLSYRSQDVRHDDLTVAAAVLRLLPIMLQAPNELQDCIIHAVSTGQTLVEGEVEAFARIFHLSTVLPHSIAGAVSFPPRVPPAIIQDAVRWGSWRTTYPGSSLRSVAVQFALDTAHINDMLGALAYLDTCYGLAVGLRRQDREAMGPPIWLRAQDADEGTTVTQQWETILENQPATWYARIWARVRDVTIRYLVPYAVWRNARRGASWLASSRMFTTPAALHNHAVYQFSRAYNVVSTQRGNALWILFATFVATTVILFATRWFYNWLTKTKECQMEQLLDAQCTLSITLCGGGCATCAAIKRRKCCKPNCKHCTALIRGKSDYDLEHIRTVVHESMQASSESEEVRTRRAQRRPRAEDDSEVCAEALTDVNADQVISGKLTSNMFVMTSVVNRVNEVVEVSGIGIFVKGRTMLTCKHVYLSMGDVITLTSLKSSLKYTFTKGELEEYEVKTSNGENKDVLLLVMPKNFPTMAAIQNHFIKADDLNKFEKASVSAVTHRAGVITRIQSAAVPHHHMDTLKYSHKTEHIMVRDYYEYTAETKPGDCGAPLVAHSTNLTGKIVGLHVAGATRPGTAYATSVTFELLQAAFERVPKTAQVEWKVHIEEEVELPIQGSFLPLSTTTPIGSPNKTKLVESSIHEAITPITTLPSALKPFTVDGVVKDPMLMALSKNAGRDVPIDKKVLKECVQAVIPTVTQSLDGPLIYSIEEAALGIDGSERVRCLDRQSSAGYPWVLATKLPGKQQWLGKGEEKFIAPDLREAIEEREAAALRGERLTTIWVDTLKDERRPIAKVEAGNTRSFACGPIDYNILFRRHFLSFFANAMDNRINNEISVGTDPYSFDWQKTYTKLIKYGPNLTSGDFSNFDGSLSADLLWAVYDVINEWYLVHGEENYELVRFVLWLDIVFSVHLLHNILYMWTHSQPSGNPATTIINCLAVKLAVRYAFVMETGLSPHVFEDYCSMVCYGDDVNVNVKPGTDFDSFNMQRGLAKLGLTYTDAEKTGNLKKYVSIKDIKYLKRSFRYEERLQRYVAPLELSVVLEMCNWVRGTEDVEASTIENVETAIRELALHDPETFSYVRKLTQACVRNIGRAPKQFSRDHLLDCFSTGLFKLQWGDSKVDNSCLRM